MQTPLVLRLVLALTLLDAAGSAAVRAQSPAQVARPPAPTPPLQAGDDELEVSTFYQGEFDRPTYSLWGPRLACGIDLNAWAYARCGGKRRWLYKPATNAESGNRCGYRGFVLVCFNR
jgi:hypothetical protein